MAGRGPDEGAAKAVPDQRGVSPPCPDPEDGPGVEDATSGAPEGGVPIVRHAAPSSGADDDVAPFGGPRPHSREGQGKGRRQPRASPLKRPMNHAWIAAEVLHGVVSRQRVEAAFDSVK